jgi:short-subunit dehydrogenase
LDLFLWSTELSQLLPTEDPYSEIRNPQSEIRNLVALITGGGTGIGRGIALALARRGYNVALVGRRAERLREVARMLERHGVWAVVLAADLSDPGDLSGIIERVRAELGPLDLLVNNAGTLAGGNLGTLTQEEIARAVATNLTAPIELTRQFLPDLRERHGAVVFVASAMSLVPMPSASLYSATKSGLRAFAQSLRYELEPTGVSVMLAYPPPTDTDMTREMAKASGLPRFPRRNPEVVGEQIVRALLAGRKELIFGRDRTLILLHRLLPVVLRAVFRSQRARFERMMNRK